MGGDVTDGRTGKKVGKIKVVSRARGLGGCGDVTNHRESWDNAAGGSDRDRWLN